MLVESNHISNNERRKKERSCKEAAKEAAPLPSNVDPELVAKILANPEMAALLTSLAKSIL